MISLENRWVLVTGAGRGLGRLTALKLIEHRASLLLVSRKAEHTADIEEKAKSEGLKAVSFGCDLSVKEDVEKLLEELREYPVDVVFNNAGLQPSYRAGIWDTPWEEYELSFKINTIAPMMICYELLPKMLERGFGRILNTTSGIDGEPQQGPYSAGKAALDKVTKDLCRTVRSEDVLLFLTDPGWCRTDMGGPNAPNSPESAITGYIAGALAEKGRNGMLIRAQEYRDMSLEEAVKKIEDTAG